MTQPLWRDPQAPPGYDVAPGPYDEPYATLRGHDSRRDGQSGPKSDPRGRTRRRWGTRPGRLGVFAVIGSAALGALVTAVTNSQPGLVLGVFLVAGTVAGALAVKPRAVYLIIPVPALAYLATGTIAGLIYDRGSDTSKAALAINGTQWIAGGFLAMAAATVAAIVITAARWRRQPRR